MGYSYVNYTGNGVTRDYTFSFPYLNSQHIHVYVQGTEQTVGVMWTFTGPSSIQFAQAPLDGEIITIKRTTSLDSRLVNFTNGSILDEGTQNLDSKQAFYLVQEAYDVLNLSGEEGSAYFTSRESILSALTGWIDESLLTEDLQGNLNYLRSQWEWSELFAPSTLDVYEAGVYTDALAEDHASLEVLTDQVTATVATVNNNVAILSLMSDQFYVKLDANGYVAGFGLYNDAQGSEFVVNVDKFGVIKTDGTGTKKPFVIDTATGNVGVDGNLIVTGSVTAAKMNVTQLSAITANLGTVTAGTIQSGNWSTTAGSQLDLTNGVIKLGGSSSPAFHWDGTQLTFNMPGDDSDPAKIIFSGSNYSGTYTNEIYTDSSGANLFIGSPTAGTGKIDLTGNYVEMTCWLNPSNPRTLRFHGGIFQPTIDNAIQAGTSSYRFSVMYSAGGVLTTSDARLKSNIQDGELGLDFINALRPVTYEIGDRKAYGLLAQEVLETAPEFTGVEHDIENDAYNMNYDHFIPALIKAVQELDRRTNRWKSK